MQVWQLMVIGVAVHVILLFSVLEIYFTSPFVHGMTPHAARGKPPAKRVVLLVGDGMRADKFFEVDETGKPNAPFLRTVIEEKGAWGISHTRVPTASRPCYIAMTSGFYEDLGSVTKGWKEAPMDFDSVFNQSRHTWAWGSQSMLSMFSKGSRGSPVEVTYTPPYLHEVFGQGDNLQPVEDNWAFSEVKNFFAGVEKNASLKRLLKEDKLAFFLHLSSLDSMGHVHKPHTKKYAQVIGNLDEGVKNITLLFKKFYNDSSTAFIVTADHGMTDWGAHGSSNPEETQTPLVAWGAGVRAPEKAERCGDFEDNHCLGWKLNHRARVDMKQADMAPFMAYLIGTAYPVSSLGELPVSYLGVGDNQKAEAMLANARQMVAQFLVKMNQVKNRALWATFRPFRFRNRPLSLTSDQTQNNPMDSEPGVDESATSEPMLMLKNIETLIEKGQYTEAIHASQYVVRTAVKGLRYYQTYDRAYLGLSISLGFLGWMGFVFVLMIRHHTSVSPSLPQETKPSSVIYTVFGAIAVAVIMLLYIQSLPWTNYCYCLLPVLLWLKVAQGWREIHHIVRRAVEQRVMRSVLLYIMLTAIILLFLVQSFSYRELLSLGLLLMAMWVFFTPVFAGKNMGTWLGWLLSCTVVAIFPLLPLVKNIDFNMVLVSGVVAISLGAFLALRISRSHPAGSVNTVSKTVHFIQLLLIAISIVLVGLTRNQAGPTGVIHKTSWCILCVSLLLPLLTGVSMEGRLFSLCLASLAPYILMTISYESLFMLSFMCLLYFWLRVESQLAAHRTQEQTDLVMTLGPTQSVLNKRELSRHSRPLQLDDLRVGVFYVVFMLTSMFGTGNIASINSYDPVSVECFQDVLKPSIAFGIIFVKLVLPLVVATCVLQAVQGVTRISLPALAMLVLLMSDFMGMNFLFQVRDDGSWLEIGASVDHYVISMGLTVLILVFLTLTQVLTSFSLMMTCSQRGVRASWAH